MPPPGSLRAINLNAFNNLVALSQGGTLEGILLAFDPAKTDGIAKLAQVIGKFNSTTISFLKGLNGQDVGNFLAGAFGGMGTGGPQASADPAIVAKFLNAKTGTGIEIIQGDSALNGFVSALSGGSNSQGLKNLTGLDPNYFPMQNSAFFFPSEK